ncbi:MULTISPECIES: hypothetical protein [Thalassospira]|uniref:hypothetical protein n=1 Tax=Thalassospira TaxID=168934 RepID=UPI0002DDD2BF|nr:MULTISPECIES: hypothetical protein [Thalassospira]
MIHGFFIRHCRHPSAPLASAWCVLCRLSTSSPWLWLVRPGAIETAPALGLVLLHELPRLLVAFGEGALGHG